MEQQSDLLRRDWQSIYESLSPAEWGKMRGASILVTGFAGSIGFTLLHFFAMYGETLRIRKIYGIDNFTFGKPAWVERLAANPLFDLREQDITICNLDFAGDADYIFHMASLASPVFYRKHPLETIDADVIGVKRLLDFFKRRPVKGFLFFSSSEIYGDPDSEHIPTPESYWGNVNPCGPRACYDESKRLGETICYNYASLYKMPVTIVRPFNNYGPGMRINDLRVMPDFAKAVLDNTDITLYSDGQATRTFDYIPDAVTGYLKCILYGSFEVFNIGSDVCEQTILSLAEQFRQIGREEYGYCGKIRFEKHTDTHYLTDNPKRRCPDISKAKSLLGYSPRVSVEEGIRSYLAYLSQTPRQEIEWGI